MIYYLQREREREKERDGKRVRERSAPASPHLHLNPSPLRLFPLNPTCQPYYFSHFVSLKKKNPLLEFSHASSFYCGLACFIGIFPLISVAYALFLLVAAGEHKLCACF